MTKIIGIYGWSTGENSFGVTKTYLDFANKFGNVRILTPDNFFDESIDLLLLTGGMDLNPNSYGDIPNYFTSNIDVFKQHVYDKCLPNYINNKIPIFGICLGFQQICAYFGSSLTQHLPYHKQSDYRGKEAHDVNIINQDLRNQFGTTFKVNSHHHQGVLLKDLKGLIPLFVAKNEEYLSKELSIVEGVKHPELPIVAVQSHPEEFYTSVIYNLFNSLLND